MDRLERLVLLLELCEVMCDVPVWSCSEANFVGGNLQLLVLSRRFGLP